MSGRIFVDSNIFIYGLDHRDLAKQARASNLLRGLGSSGTAVISYQVIHEVLNWALTKAPVKLSPHDARWYLSTAFRPFHAVASSVQLAGEAVRLHSHHQISWYDSLIVAAALEANCSTLLTEDLQHGQRFASLTVRNPFLE